MINSLTSLRFFAALWVVLFHARSEMEVPFLAYVNNGARGVDFFFILSGFVLWHVYGDRSFNRADYFWRRFARIYPLHLVMLLPFLMMNWDISGFVKSAALLHAFGTTDGLVLNGPSWTISAEMFAYAVFGLLAFWVTPLRLLIFTIVIVVVAHAAAVALGQDQFVHLTHEAGWLRILPLFCLGVFGRMLLPHLSGAIAAGLFVLGLVLLLVTGQITNVGYTIIPGFFLLIVGAAGLGAAKRFPLNWGPLVFLGEISYSIYLTHVFVMFIWLFHGPGAHLGWMALPGYLIVLVGFSTATYLFIEKPARHWLNAWFARKGAAPAQ